MTFNMLGGRSIGRWLRGLKWLVGLTIAALCGYAAWRVAPHFVVLHKYNQRIAPLVKEARLLEISYDHVLEFPYQTVGKPAIWCIWHNVGERGLFEGREDKRLQMLPYPSSEPVEIPKTYGNCENMLVLIQGLSVSTNTLSSQFSVHKSSVVTVEFIAKI